MLEQFTLTVPQNVHCGNGTLEKLPEILRQKKAKNVAIIVDKTVSTLDVYKKLNNKLEADFNIQQFTDVPPEPTEDQVKKVADNVMEFDTEIIVAIGGGSVMDAAKFVSVMLTNPEFYVDLTDKEKITNKPIPLICIPTSAGTGSEATPNAIILIPEKQVKVGVVHNYFLPTDVILDPLMTRSLPKSVTAATGLDAFCHCIETYISKKTNPFARLFGLEGIKLISKYLRRAYDNPNDMEAREKMAIAAFYGGVAITSSSTVAIHALSYPLGGTYHIAHGISNAILLPYVMEYNMDAIEDSIPDLCSAMGLDTEGLNIKEKGELLVKEIFALCRYVNIPESVIQYGVKPEDLDRLAISASEVRRLLDQNPKEMSIQDIKSIYIQLL
ncbi:MAG: iron-containing alcohol dehydrogenase [Erysipelotrichia bacterium]|nr:iron-containing alcohol dehydrogenase [Erysipelotrichia bacterium]